MKNRTRRFVVFAAVLATVVAFLAYDIYATSLTTQLSVSLISTLASSSDLTSGQVKVISTTSTGLANGVGASQADVVWSDTRSLATGANEDLDLIGGGLLDPFGAAFAPVKIKMIVIEASSSNTTNLTLFGDALSVPIVNTAATTMTLQPGGVFVISAPPAAGIAVGAGATDIIQIANGAGATAYYDIMIVGTSS